MNGAELRETLASAFARLADSSEELRALDASVGDGDLGITVSLGSKAVITRLAELPDVCKPSDVIAATADSFGNANPSTFAALVSAGLMAGSRSIESLDEIFGPEVVAVGRVAAETIAKRGKSAVGDKTLLDALVPSLDAAEQHPTDGVVALAAAISAAALGIAETAGIAARKGRAAWAGERGIGEPDAGATAYLRFLEALR